MSSVDEVEIIDEGPNPAMSVAAEEVVEIVTPVIEPVSTIVEPVKTNTVVADEPRQRCEQHFNVNAAENIDNVEVVNLPSDINSRVEDTIKKLPNINQFDSEDSRTWAAALSEGSGLTVLEEMLISTLLNGRFTQKPEHNGTPLVAGKPVTKRRSEELEIMSGEAAVINAITYLGMGSLFQAPMWHSGFWVTFKPPAEAELIELNRQIASDKIKLGRYSYGLLYSNLTAYTIARLVDFAKEHIYSTSVMSDQLTTANIKDHLDSRDIFAFLWGFATTMYPRGFNYQRGCITDPEKCKHIEKDTLNVSKLQWTNPDELTDWQKTFMSNRSARSQTLDNVKRYKTELAKTQNKVYVVNKDTSCELKFTLKSPTVNEYIDTGYRWIGEITAQVEAMLGSDSVLGERNEQILKHGQASLMRQYSHWVESIEYGSTILKDRETIENTLAAFSADDAIREEYTDMVKEYINYSTISIIGIPIYKCPACGKDQEPKNVYPKVSEVIPLDVVQLFFEVLSQRIGKIARR